MEKNDCPNLEKCPMFALFRLQATTELFIRRYCNGDYEKCARKKLKDSGKEVPENLLPDGDTLPAHWSAP